MVGVHPLTLSWFSGERGAVIKISLLVWFRGCGEPTEEPRRNLGELLGGILFFCCSRFLSQGGNDHKFD